MVQKVLLKICSIPMFKADLDQIYQMVSKLINVELLQKLWNRLTWERFEIVGVLVRTSHSCV